MKLNRKELRKIQYDFNSYANRLLQAAFEDYTDVLGKFIAYITETPIIFDYISDCGTCEFDLQNEVKTVGGSYGEYTFSTGKTEEEEVRNVYAILKYIADNEMAIHFGIAYGYSNSKKYQDKIKGFNERFVMILIRHIERYLTKVGIDMGVDERIVYNVTVENGQAIIATDGSTVTATNQIGVDGEQLQQLVADVLLALDGLSAQDEETVRESLNVIQAEASSKKPKKSMLKAAISALKTVTCVGELGAAIAALIEFVSKLF